MTRPLFWGVFLGLCAIIAHLAYVLFTPRHQMGLITAEALLSAPLNSLAVLDAAAQARLFPDDTPAELRAVCPFDLAGGNIELSGSLPDTPWTLAVYSPDGGIFYTLGHIQAGTSNVLLTIKKGKSLADYVTPGAGENAIGNGWTVESPDQTGLAVIWAVMDNPLSRPRHEAVLKASSCKVKAG